MARQDAPSVTRRRFTALLGGFGAAGAALPSILTAAAQAKGKLGAEDLEHAERLLGIEFTPSERELMLEGLDELKEDYAKLRSVQIDTTVPPALRFDPELPGCSPPAVARTSVHVSRSRISSQPEDPEELAFLSVRDLGHLVKTRRITSEHLTGLFLERLRRYDPVLRCVVTLTEERAMAMARRADRELAEGRWRGPLHGIPWGAKDLLSVRGYPTTWGAEPYRDQVIDENAEVVRRLDDAGAVLVAKLTLGALAWGDVWFGGKTRNPWNPEQGSSGSSAGSASATAAGLVPFAIGSETWGSIVSPSTRCGTTGLRPTFGRVSRHGAMALSWSMDKLGPICRSVEDCALVLAAITGADGRDPSAVDRPFAWDARATHRKIRVGYLKSDFESELGEDDDHEWRALDLATLEVLRSLGFDLNPLELPDLPIGAMALILNAEAAAAFDELTRSDRDDLLVRQIADAWPNVFRTARLIPAVEYLQANRLRTLAMREMERILTDIDVYVGPSFGGNNLLLTNLTGHPAVVLPNGFRSDGTPTSITFTGHLFGEAEVLTVARAYQEATGFHLRHPDLRVAVGKA